MALPQLAGVLALGVLAALLPFEPRRPILPLPGTGGVTFLEAVAALGTLVLLCLHRRGAAALVRRPPAPLLLLWAYAAAHLLSAAATDGDRGASMKFALRMAAMAVFGMAVAAVPPEVLRRALLALAASASAVAVLALAETHGLRVLDGFLGLFREMPFNVGGTRRATAGSEYPNLAAAMMLYGLLAGTGLATARTRAVAVVAPWSLLLCSGLLFTYSRGALAAAAAALAVLVALHLPKARRAVAAPVVALAVLLVSGSAFAWGGEIFRLRLASEGTGRWYEAVYAPEESALTLVPGERRLTKVRVTNAGLKAWTAGEQFHLSHHWYDPGRRWMTDGGRAILPADVPPGGTVTLEAELAAPEAEGRYVLLWDMVHEHTTWFSGQGVAPAAVAAVVSRRGVAAAPAAPVPETAALAWRPQRADLWRLALGMWQERPWLGFGPDSYRRLYGSRAGHALWDPRVYANNTFLEAAATTGTFGLAALGGTLAATLAGALRAWLTSAPEARPTAAALLAVALGMTAHGVVDYVLAFTGHYLALGLVVGGVSGILHRSGA